MKSLLNNLLNKWHIIFPNTNKLEETLVQDCNTLIDVGCGENSGIRSFKNKPYSIGVEIFDEAIEKSKQNNIHDKYVKINVMDIGTFFSKNSHDCVMANGLIEHLNKEEGYKLLQMMERIAIKKVFLTTPNGFVKQGNIEGNPWQIHHSGWTPLEMKNLGYKVIGISGFKCLKGGEGKIKYWPHTFWTIISILSEPLVKHFPSLAFEQLCIKDMRK